MRLLVVEDDRRLADVLRRGLAEEGYAVDLCENGKDAVLQAELQQYDLLIVDIMLPGKDGLAVCRELRSMGVSSPILVLTARDTVDDVVRGLEAGADDYLTKPFAFRELRARLQSLLRRASGWTSPRLQIGDLILDAASREVRRAGQHLSLTNKEYQLLEYLVHNRGRILSRTMIQEHIWGYGYEGLSNTVDVHMKRLREKIDAPDEPSMIETVRGVGYPLLDESA